MMAGMNTQSLIIVRMDGVVTGLAVNQSTKFRIKFQFGFIAVNESNLN